MIDGCIFGPDQASVLGSWSSPMTFVTSIVVVTKLMAGLQIVTVSPVTADTVADVARPAPHGSALHFFAQKRRDSTPDDTIDEPFTSEQSRDKLGTSKGNAT